MLKIVCLADVSLDSFFPIRIQNLDHKFAHFLEELLFVFLLHVTAGVGRRLGGPGRAGGADAGLGSGLDLGHGEVQRDVHLLLSSHLPGVLLALDLLQPSLLPLDLLPPGPLLPPLSLLLLPLLMTVVSKLLYQ